MEELLKVENLKKYFPVNVASMSHRRKTVDLKAIDGVSFYVNRGETVALVGESGSGKSTTADTILGLYKSTAGKIWFRDMDISTMDIAKRPLSLKKEIQVVFQDPGTSLNPRRTVGQSLEVPLRVHNMVERGKVSKRARELLATVGLSAEYMDKYPRTIGGGERQLVAIARALAVHPSLVILDEPTSALDESMQAKIITMLVKLQTDLNLSYLFITHNLSLVRNVATRVEIMYLGKIYESAATLDFFTKPLHPYTQMLLSSVPVVTEAERKLKPKHIISTGEIPNPVNVPPGCGFCSRCPVKLKKCSEVEPPSLEVTPGHVVKCFLYDENQANG
jgi:peptide/nickel transport system ATP-binding protein